VKRWDRLNARERVIEPPSWVIQFYPLQEQKKSSGTVIQSDFSKNPDLNNERLNGVTAQGHGFSHLAQSLPPATALQQS
jgi:hypothetical protein